MYFTVNQNFSMSQCRWKWAKIFRCKFFLNFNFLTWNLIANFYLNFFKISKKSRKRKFLGHGEEFFHPKSIFAFYKKKCERDFPARSLTRESSSMKAWKFSLTRATLPSCFCCCFHQWCGNFSLFLDEFYFSLRTFCTRRDIRRQLFCIDWGVKIKFFMVKLFLWKKPFFRDIFWVCIRKFLCIMWRWASNLQ